MKRRVTVHFDAVRVVVPVEETSTVADLAEAAVLRYKRAIGKADVDVRILRMKCISDDGILDMEDKIVDVFDEISDQILAIYDEQSPDGSGEPTSTTNASDGKAATSQSKTYIKSPVVGRVKDSVVEITNLENPPSNGLRVSSAAQLQQELRDLQLEVGPSREEKKAEDEATPVRSSLRSDTSTPSRHRVTMSPEVEKRERMAETNKSSASSLSRSFARKSRLTDSFYDAKDRLDESRDLYDLATSSRTPTIQRKRLPPLPADDPNHTILVFPDEEGVPLGIEVTGVVDVTAANRLTAVQILRIDSDGRIGLDGRLRVEDNIVEIDGRPVYQMSITRARAYLSDMGARPAPTLTVSRPVSSFAEEESTSGLTRNDLASSTHKRPILSALQQANTQQIGHTIVIELKKSPAGFGFTVTGRETAKSERLFYIGTVKPNGVALGHLRAGDRLLEINGESTGGLTQADVVDRLKQAEVGQTVAFLVSRIAAEEETGKSSPETTNSEIENQPPPGQIKPRIEDRKLKDGCEELELIIPLNDTGSAGLGVSLKARVTVKSDGKRHDCGIFIKNVMHGGAAFKDGRLLVNDRIVGIEEVNLEGCTNAEASEAVTKKLKAIGPTATYARLRILRPTSQHHREDSRITVEGADSMLAGSSLSSPTRISRTSGEEEAEKRMSVMSRLDDSELVDGGIDPFDREAPARKSMSEKRGMGAASDPSHTKLFQDIKHQRQSSAPPASFSTSSSFHGQTTARSASQRAAARARSHSVHPPRHPLTPGPAPMKLTNPVLVFEDSEPPKRRSMSVESISRTPNVYEKNKGNEYKAGRVSSSKSFRQAMGAPEEEPIYDYGNVGHSIHPYPPGSPIIVQARNSANRDKDKQRRKSVGSAMKSFFGLGGGSKSRETSPDKGDRVLTEEKARRRDEEERRRIQEHYDRLRQKEMDSNRPQQTTPVTMRRDLPHRIYSEYEPAYVPQPLGTSPAANYELIDRYQAHRYPVASTGREREHSGGAAAGSGGAGGHHQGLPPPPSYSTIPGSKSYHGGDNLGINGNPNYERSPNRRQAPDYYHMFNSWFAYSGGGAAGAAPAIKHMQPQSESSIAAAQQHGRVQLQERQQLQQPSRDHRPSTRPQQNHQNSTPIAFPSTRFAFAPLLPSYSSATKSSNPERLSMRARKKQRRNVQSEIISADNTQDLPIAPPPPPPPPLVKKQQAPPPPSLKPIPIMKARSEDRPTSLDVESHHRNGYGSEAKSPGGYLRTVEVTLPGNHIDAYAKQPSPARSRISAFEVTSPGVARRDPVPPSTPGNQMIRVVQHPLRQNAPATTASAGLIDLRQNSVDGHQMARNLVMENVAFSPEVHVPRPMYERNPNATRAPPMKTMSRKVTSIDEPADSEYCRVWNQWNTRSGGSLPARRAKDRKQVHPALFEGITDC